MTTDEQIDGQLSVFDLLPPERDDPLGNKTIAQIAADISMLVGVNFNPKRGNGKMKCMLSMLRHWIGRTN